MWEARMIRLPQDKNIRVALMAAFGAVTMVGAAFAAVPLYDLFCRVTGYGGTTQVAVGEAGEILDREVTIYFDANTERDMPWTFEQRRRAHEQGLTTSAGSAANQGVNFPNNRGGEKDSN